MAKGDGGISPVKDKTGKIIRNKWRITLSFGDDSSGKRIRKTQVVNGTKTEARAIRDKIRSDYFEAQELGDPEKTFCAFAQEWLEHRTAMGEVCVHTLKSEAERIESMNKHIGNVKLVDITPRMVDKMYTDIRNEKSKRLGKPISSTTMHRIHATLKQILKQAVNYDLILRNPVDRCLAVPKVADPNRKSLKADEAQELLKYLNECIDEAYKEHAEKEERQEAWGVQEGRSSLRGISKLSYLLAVRIGLATGMRRGEIFGLNWGSFNSDEGTIAIDQSLTQFGDNGCGLKDTKTVAGRRVIHIDDATAKDLMRFGKLQVELLHKLRLLRLDTYVLPSTQPLLCSNIGGRCDMRNFHSWWQKFRVAAGFPNLQFHELRHTQATLLLAKGVDVKTVQTRMGHANASLTLNWYAHPDPENDAKAAALIGNLFATQDEASKTIA